jgi:hypothetical protein
VGLAAHELSDAAFDPVLVLPARLGARRHVAPPIPAGHRSAVPS